MSSLTKFFFGSKMSWREKEGISSRMQNMYAHLVKLSVLIIQSCTVHVNTGCHNYRVPSCISYEDVPTIVSLTKTTDCHVVYY